MQARGSAPGTPGATTSASRVVVPNPADGSKNISVPFPRVLAKKGVPKRCPLNKGCARGTARVSREMVARQGRVSPKERIRQLLGTFWWPVPGGVISRSNTKKATRWSPCFLWELSEKPSDTLDISRHVTTQPRVAVHIGARWTTWTPAFALFPWISGRSSFPTSSTSKRDRYWREARRFGKLFPGPGLCRGLSTTRG